MALLSSAALNDLVETVSRYKDALGRFGGQVVSAANQPGYTYPETPLNPIPVAVDSAGHTHWAMPNIVRTPINALNAIAHGERFWEPQHLTDDTGRVITTYPKGADVGNMAMLLAGGANSPRGLPVEGEPVLYSAYSGPRTVVDNTVRPHQPFAGDYRLGPPPGARWEPSPEPPPAQVEQSNVVPFPGSEARSGGGQRQWTEVRPGYDISESDAASKLQSTDPKQPGYDTLMFSPKSGLNRQGEWAGAYSTENLPSVLASLDYAYPERGPPTGIDVPKGFRSPVNLDDYRQPGKAANENVSPTVQQQQQVEGQFPAGSMWSWKINTDDFAARGRRESDQPTGEGRDMHFLAIPTGKYEHGAADNVQVRLFDAKNGVEWPFGASGNYLPHGELKPYTYNGVGASSPWELNDNPPSQWSGFSPTHFYTAEADDELHPTMVTRTDNSVPSLGLVEVRLPDGNGTTRMVPQEHLWELPTYDTPPSGTTYMRPGNWEPEPSMPANDR